MRNIVELLNESASTKLFWASSDQMSFMLFVNNIKDAENIVGQYMNGPADDFGFEIKEIKNLSKGILLSIDEDSNMQIRFDNELEDA